MNNEYRIIFNIPYSVFYLRIVPDRVALPDLVASGVADAVAVGVGVNIGVGSTVITGVGAGVVTVSVYLPLNQTKYAAKRTMIKIITTIVTFLFN